MNTYQELGIRAQLFFRHSIICHTETEGKAFLKVNKHLFNAHDTRLVVMGYQLHKESLADVRGKVGLIFGRDVLASLWDIKVAGWLNKQDVKLRFDQDAFYVRWRNEEFRFADGKLTLNAFERASGFRAGARTYKPMGFNSFLEQLKKS